MCGLEMGQSMRLHCFATISRRWLEFLRLLNFPEHEIGTRTFRGPSFSQHSGHGVEARSCSAGVMAPSLLTEVAADDAVSEMAT